MYIFTFYCDNLTKEKRPLFSFSEPDLEKYERRDVK